MIFLYYLCLKNNKIPENITKNIPENIPKKEIFRNKIPKKKIKHYWIEYCGGKSLNILD